MIKVTCYNSDQKDVREKWNRFVLNHADSQCYHLFDWKDIIEHAFGLKSFYLYASRNNDGICGILPLIFSKSFFFGRYLTSIPFYNYGGILAVDNEVENALLDKAEKVADQLNASHIEFRHCKASSLELPTKTHKVRMILELPNDPEILWKGFKAKASEPNQTSAT